MRVAFYTFGCKLNQYETESLAGSFQAGGYDLVSNLHDAELFIINTCTVTSKSEQKARKLIRALANRNPNALIIVTGCYAQVDRELLQELGTAGANQRKTDTFRNVSPDTESPANIVIVPQVDKPLLHDFAGFLHDPLAAGCFQQDKKAAFLRFYQAAKTPVPPVTGDSAVPAGQAISFSYQVEDYIFHSRAFLKIQDGCDYRCTYCRVPLARGSAVSLEPAAIFHQLERLEEKGYREVVLTGVNITAYTYGELTFPRLLKEILARVSKLRIRLSSLEPEKITPELCEVLTHPSLCPHFHIPVQSGSDRTLAAMKRRYQRRQLEEVLSVLQQIKPGAFLAADIIVGFPGETDDDFLQTYRLLEQFKFSYLHVFPFSPRPGTPAFHLTPRVRSSTIRSRVQQLLDLSAKLFSSYLADWKGRQVVAVLETRQEIPARETFSATAAGGDTSGEVWEGLAANYLKLIISGIPAAAAGAGRLVSCSLAADEKLSSPYPARYCTSL